MSYPARAEGLVNRITALLSRSPGLLNRGPWGPAFAENWFSLFQLQQLTRPGFELVSPCPFPTTITITPRAPLFIEEKENQRFPILPHMNFHKLVGVLVIWPAWWRVMSHAAASQKCFLLPSLKLRRPKHENNDSSLPYHFFFICSLQACLLYIGFVNPFCW